MENNNTNNEQNLTSEELQKKLEEALEAQKKLQEQIDSLKKEEEVQKEKAEVDVEEYIKQKEMKKEEAKNKPFSEKLKGYGFTIVFFICLAAFPLIIIKGKDFLTDLQYKRYLEKMEVRNNLNGDWTSEVGTKMHIDEDGTVYFIEYEGNIISHINKGVVHEDMVCFQNTCTENEEETYESGGADFKTEYTNKGSDSYKDYKEIPEDAFVPTGYQYYDFKNKTENTVSIKGVDFTK